MIQNNRDEKEIRKRTINSNPLSPAIDTNWSHKKYKISDIQPNTYPILLQLGGKARV